MTGQEAIDRQLVYDIRLRGRAALDNIAIVNANQHLRIESVVWDDLTAEQEGDRRARVRAWEKDLAHTRETLFFLGGDLLTNQTRGGGPIRAT